MHLITIIGKSILLLLSDVKMSEDDRETPNVNGKKPNGGVTQDVEVFAFFKDTEKVYKL